MAEVHKTDFEFILECERLIQEFRGAVRGGDKELMGNTYMELLRRVQPILVKRAHQLAYISDGAVREALDGMIDRLGDNMNSLTFHSLETQFGAYLHSMPTRIVRKVREKYRPSDVSLRIESLDEPAGSEQRAKSELIADPQSSTAIDDLASRIDLQALLDHLRPVERQVMLARLDGTTNNEIAEVLGVSAATATRIYQRAKSRLQPLLQADSERGTP